MTPTFLDKIKTAVRTANHHHDLLTSEMVEEVMPSVVEAINAQAKRMNYDGFTYNSAASDYPAMIYSLLYESCIREVVLKYLEDNHQFAWFKPMYFDARAQEKLFANKTQAEGRMNRDGNTVTEVVMPLDFGNRYVNDTKRKRRQKHKPAELKYFKGYYTVNGVKKQTDAQLK